MEKDEINNETSTNPENTENPDQFQSISTVVPGELCATGSIVEGVVSGIAKFGAFVDLPDKRTGLVHISQISDGFVREVRDYLEVGQKVNVYIMKCEGDKIRLSIKEANDKLGTPHLKPLNMGNVSGGKGEIDKNRKLDSMLYRYNKEFEDTRKNMFNRDTRYGLN